MGRVLFINKYPLIESYSIIQKIDGQMRAVSRLGYEVDYITFDHKYVYLNTFSEDKKTVIKKAFLGKTKLYYHLFSFFDIYNAAKKIVNQSKYDFVYFRYSPLSYTGYSMCKKLNKNSKIVVEISTYPLGREKPKNILRAIYWKYSEYWNRKSAKFVDLYTLIGEKADSFRGVKAINIDNGVSLKDIPKIQHENTSKIHILTVASMCTWQGYDRIIEGMAKWTSTNRKKVIIDLVGGEGDGSLALWKNMVCDYGLEDNILFHGRKIGKDLDELFNQATIGLGSLGMYRRGFSTASILKIREYVARGLPFVYANDDPNINSKCWWAKELPNNSEAIDMEDVYQFALAVQNWNYADVGSVMREYAKKYMSWEVQFEKIIAQLKRN